MSPPDRLIRASSTPTVLDCERRFLAENARDLAETAGFYLRQPRPHIGAAVGVGVHAGVEHYLRGKLEGVTRSWAEIDEIAVEAMRDEGLGADMDAATPALPIAETQVRRMHRRWIRQCAPDHVPMEVERRREMMVQPATETTPAIVATGKLDMLAIRMRSVPGIVDLKGGKNRPSATLVQIGTYSLLSRAAGMEVDEVATHWIPRVPVRSGDMEDQPPVEIIPSDVVDAEQLASSTLKRAAGILTRFAQTGDPSVADPNPSSRLCTARFCIAAGTRFCRFGSAAPLASRK